MYRLPFKMLVSKFRLSFANCGWHAFKHWSFQGFRDAEQEWTTLYDAMDVTPWPNPEYRQILSNCYYLPAQTFPVDADFASDQFRIILGERACMHIRAFELFGTLRADWSLDTPPSSGSDTHQVVEF